MISSNSRTKFVCFRNSDWNLYKCCTFFWNLRFLLEIFWLCQTQTSITNKLKTYWFPKFYLIFKHYFSSQKSSDLQKYMPPPPHPRKKIKVSFKTCSPPTPSLRNKKTHATTSPPNQKNNNNNNNNHQTNTWSQQNPKTEKESSLIHLRLTVEDFQSLMAQRGLDRIPPEARRATGKGAAD